MYAARRKQDLIGEGEGIDGTAWICIHLTQFERKKTNVNHDTGRLL